MFRHLPHGRVGRGSLFLDPTRPDPRVDPTCVHSCSELSYTRINSIVAEAAIDSHVAIIMLGIGGAESYALPLLPPIPPPIMPPPPPTPPWPPQIEPPDTTDAVGMSLMTGNRVISATDNDTSDTTPLYIFPTPPPDQMQSPSWIPEPQETYVVGPLIYMYLSTVNVSDAGFSVDLLFRHPDLKASLFCRVVFDFAS